MTAEFDLSHFDFTHYANLLCEGLYIPYMADSKFRELHATVPEHSPIKIWSYYFLYLMAKQSLNVPGDFFECGVFRGGSASFLAKLTNGYGKRLHLFDTFRGMPVCDPMRDPLHIEGDFSDVSIDEVRATVGHEHSVSFHQGKIPDTFAGMDECQIAFAHVDVDIYRSVMDCCEFIYPRLAPGGVMVLDDYGHATCIGARQAADEYFAGTPSAVVPLYTGQALVVKLP